MDNGTGLSYGPLERFDGNLAHEFIAPVKKINTGQDVSTFLVSKAYRDIAHFLFQLNRAMFPLMTKENGSDQTVIQSFQIGSPIVHFSDTVIQLRKLLFTLNNIVDEVPLDTGPRRFGNLSFRKWYELVESRAAELLNEYLPLQVCSFKHGSDLDALTELRGYFIGSFGSPQRLDYGTGHELSFLAFLACVWKLGGFLSTTPGQEERGIVLGVIEPYLGLVRRLILTYTLEPAGSHGVWGLDDHSFLPYIFGSAQYGPPITDTDQVPTEGSLIGVPDPGIVTKANMVERYRKTNMYFSAIGFIYDVKKGPFWEHSPTLYDISGIRAGWGKINKGMVKMYNAEVLSKFPVVQHFPFGSLFSWDRDSNAVESPSSIHTSSQPVRNDTGSVSISSASMRYPLPDSTRLPWTAQRTSHPDMVVGAAQAPWVKLPPSNTAISRVAGSSSYGFDGSASSGTNAPISRQDIESMHPFPNRTGESDSGIASLPPPTKAPWAE